MPNKSAEDWLEDIDAGLEYRRQFGMEAAWHKLTMNYMHDPNSDTAVGPNLVFAMGDSLVSTLVVPDPEFLITPTRRSGVEKAPIVESLCGSMVKKLKLKRHVDLSLLHNYLYGVSILKIGYDSEFGWAPYYDIGEGNNLLGMTITQFDKQGRRIESPEIQPGWPWVRPVAPHDFVVPWGVRDLDDAPWCAHRVIRHIDSIKSDPKYINKQRLQPMISMEDWVKSYSKIGTSVEHLSTAQKKTRATYSKKPEFVELWEIRDRMTGEVIVVSRDYDKVLRKAPDAIQATIGMPFVTKHFNKHPLSFWSTPPAYYLGQIQKTQYDIALQAEKQRRISVLKFMYRKNALSEEALSRLLSADVGAAEGVETQFPLNEILAPMQTGANYDAMGYAEANRRDAREAIGFSRNQLGEFDSSSRRTAREAVIVEEGAQRRAGKKESSVIELYIETIEKVNNLAFEFWRTPREVLADDHWHNVTGDMLKGEYEYDATLSTKRSISKTERMIEALQLTAQFAMVPGIDVQALFEFLSNASSHPSIEKLLEPMIRAANLPQTGQTDAGSISTGQEAG